MAPSFQDHFSSHAASYAAFRPEYPATLGTLIASRVPSLALAVECGCGNGQLSRLLAEHFAHVIATDASADQIKHALPHPRISYHVATAESVPIADGSADLVVAAQAAHWFDLPAFYSEAVRIAKPGAMIALISYGSLRMEGEVGQLVEIFHHDTLAHYWSPERALVEAGYSSLPFPFAEEAAPALAMEASWSFHQLIGYITTWSAVRALEKAGKDVLMQQFTSELKEAWGDPQTIRDIRWPLAMRLGRMV